MFILATLASAAGVQLLPGPAAIVSPVFIPSSCQGFSQAAEEMLRPRWEIGAGEAARIPARIPAHIPACILACIPAYLLGILGEGGPSDTVLQGCSQPCFGHQCWLWRDHHLWSPCGLRPQGVEELADGRKSGLTGWVVAINSWNLWILTGASDGNQGLAQAGCSRSWIHLVLKQRLL